MICRGPLYLLSSFCCASFVERVEPEQANPIPYKLPAMLSCTNRPHLFLYVLMRVSQILVVPIGWHTDTILLWILSDGAGAGDVIISVIMRRVSGDTGADDYLRCSDQVSWHLPRDHWSEPSQIPSSWDSLENCITLRSDQRGPAITKLYTLDITHMWYTRLILSLKVISFFGVVLNQIQNWLI